MKSLKKIYIIFTCLFIFVMNLSTVYAYEDKQSVLYISSYNYDYAYVEYQLEGFSSEIDYSADVDYIFMDTKNVSYTEAETEVLNKIAADSDKYASYDCIVAADDNALDFVMKFRDTKFTDIPVVFLAINTLSKAENAIKEDEVAGINEKGYYADTIALALEIYPDITSITAITDNRVTGQGTNKQLVEAMEGTGLELKFINTTLSSKSDIIYQLENLGDDTALFFLNFIDDADGNKYTIKESINLVNEYSPLPAFRLDYPGIEYGLLGGVVIRFDHMGQQAAKLVNMVLNNQSISDVGVMTSPSSIILNREIIEKYDINIPAYIIDEAEIMNENTPFIIEYGMTLITAISLIFLAYALWSLLILRRQNAALETANNVKMDFLARMSHDMRTPITTVIGLADFGVEEKNDKQDVIYFKQIKESSMYLLELMNDILEMQRTEKNMIIINPIIVKHEHFINNIKNIIKTKSDEKSINFNFHCEECDVEYIKIDTIRITQILVNILTNAVKYTQSGGNVDWKVKFLTENHKHYAVHTITDDGVGMSEDFLKRMYEPFTQEINTESIAEGGSGLGLAVTKGLVDLIGGNIYVESKIDKGSTFIIRIPFDVPDEDELNEFKLIKKEESSIKGFSNKKILLCEDTLVNARIIIRLLESFGFEVDHAENGKIGYNLYIKNRYDLILLDIRMPVMDGLTLARKIRMQDDVIPMIAISANAFPEDIEKSIEAGINSHLSKPIDKVELYNTINILLNKKHID